MADNPTENSAPEAADKAAPAADAAAPTQTPAAEAPKADERRGGRRGQGGKGGRRERPQRQAPPKPMTDDGKELHEKVVFINRCAKVVKGGRRFSFSALMVSGLSLIHI